MVVSDDVPPLVGLSETPRKGEERYVEMIFVAHALCGLLSGERWAVSPAFPRVQAEAGQRTEPQRVSRSHPDGVDDSFDDALEVPETNDIRGVGSTG